VFDLAQSELEMVLVIKNVDQICIEWMNIFELWELEQNL
jgi:hypothetical protein